MRARGGSYLAAFVLENGAEVHGINRRTSLFNTPGIVYPGRVEFSLRTHMIYISEDDQDASDVT